MNVLVLPSQYPYPGYPFRGIFNERCVEVLSTLCEGITVLSPRPYVPPFFSLLSPRWKAYSTAISYEASKGVSVYRPAYLQFPGFGGAFCDNQSAFYCCRRMVKEMHKANPFDVILSFGLVGTGVMAWKIGRYLGIPSCGWATGRFPTSPSYRKVIGQALNNLDVMFYQSQELCNGAASLLEISPKQLSQHRHLVLARGIPIPPSLDREKERKRIRLEWGVSDQQVLVLSIGRVVRDKGIYELLDAMSIVGSRNSAVRCVVLGAMPDFDETAAVNKIVRNSEDLQRTVKILPACRPEKVWEYLCAADLFAFTSHHDGMPNSLLEAMVMGVPAVAFAIPPVVEIEAGHGGLRLIPPFDAKLFSEAILRLAEFPPERETLGELGRAEVQDRFMMKKNMAKVIQCLTRIVNGNISSP